MSDQGKWFKLWASALDDPDLENLSLENWARWARLGVYIKKHGMNGKLRIRKPANALLSLLRCATFSQLEETLRAFPNYLLEGSENSVTFTVTCKNWSKYQRDFSGDRVKRFRAKSVTVPETPHVTRQEEKRSRREVEEIRRDITPSFDFESLWAKYPRREGRKEAEKHFKASIKEAKDWLDIQNAMDCYLTHLRANKTEPQFVKMGSTWFNNWRDWVNYKAVFAHLEIQTPKSRPYVEQKPADDEIVGAEEFGALKRTLGI